MTSSHSRAQDGFYFFSCCIWQPVVTLLPSISDIGTPQLSRLPIHIAEDTSRIVLMDTNVKDAGSKFSIESL